MGAKGRRLSFDGRKCASSTFTTRDATFKLSDRQSQYRVNEKMYGISAADSAFFSARDRVRRPLGPGAVHSTEQWRLEKQNTILWSDRRKISFAPSH